MGKVNDIEWSKAREREHEPHHCPLPDGRGGRGTVMQMGISEVSAYV